MNTDFETDLRDRLRTLASEAVADVDAPIDEVPDTRVVAIDRKTRRGGLRALAVAAAIVAITVGGAAVVAQHDSDSPRPPVAVAVTQDAPGWTKIAQAPIGPRSQNAVVYTGSQVIIWGGNRDGADGYTPTTLNTDKPSSRQVLNDGAVYDVKTNTWHKMSDAPVHGIGAPASVWTGKEMIVFGSDQRQVAAYNPATDSWRKLAYAPSGCLDGGTWSGTHLVAAGDCQGGGATADFLAYNPRTDRWTAIPKLRLPDEGDMTVPTLVTVGNRVVGWTSQGGAAVLSNDMRRWEPLPASPATTSLNGLAVSDGSALLVVNGGPQTTLDRYDFVTRTWTRRVTSTSLPSTLFAGTPIAADNGFVVWSSQGYGAGSTPTTGGPKSFQGAGPGYAIFDSGTGVAGMRSTAPVRLDRSAESLVALGNGRYFMWGGVMSGPPRQPKPDGAIFSIAG